MRHLLPKKIIHLLLLLALLAGGQISAAKAMTAQQGDTTVAAEMPDMHCKACAAAASAACESLCIVLAAVLPDTVALVEAGSRDSWTSPAHVSPTHAISPETSPPRA